MFMEFYMPITMISGATHSWNLSSVFFGPVQQQCYTFLQHAIQLYPLIRNEIEYEAFSCTRPLCFFHIFPSLLGTIPSFFFCSMGVVLASPFSVLIRVRQSDRPIYNTNVDHTANPEWTAGNEPILTHDVLSG